jgi:hypothetical protein
MSGSGNYETNIVEIKKIYTDYLQNILAPQLYEGFKSMYDDSQSKEVYYANEAKKNPTILNPGILKIFQEVLSGIKKLNSNIIETETTRIRDNSKCADTFDNLIRCCVKAHIVLLTYNVSEKHCKLVTDRYHEKVDINKFIHKCYIECGTIFYNHPTLFWHGFTNNEIKHNQQIIFQLIKVGIKNALMRTIPLKDITEEYLNKDYIEQPPPDIGEKKILIESNSADNRIYEDSGYSAFRQMIYHNNSSHTILSEQPKDEVVITKEIPIISRENVIFDEQNPKRDTEQNLKRDADNMIVGDEPLVEKELPEKVSKSEFFGINNKKANKVLIEMIESAKKAYQKESTQMVGDIKPESNNQDNKFCE